MGNRLVIIIPALFALYSAGYANIGNYEVLSGPLSIGQTEHATIAMACENVICALKRDRVNVEASFTFVNNGPATDATMYFPVGVDFYIRSAGSASRYYAVSEDNPVSETPFFLHRPDLIDGGERLGAFQYALRPGDVRPDGVVAAITTLGDDLNRPGNYDTLKGFRVTANGVPVNIEIVERVVLAANDEGSGSGDAEVYAKRGTIAKWRLRFREGEKKEVTCEYALPYDVAFYADRPDIFKYSIGTGKGWAGPIGEGIVRVTYSSEELNAPVGCTAPGLPSAIVSTADVFTSITWMFKDFEPENQAEIRVLIGRHYGNTTPSGEYESTPKENRTGPGIVRVDAVPLKSEPSITAPAVDKRPRLKRGTPFHAYESSGEWWYVKLKDGTEGWLRWREVDAATGEEHINAAFAYYLTE